MYNNTTAIITGAASGIGRAIANKLSGSKINLALLDIDEKKLLKIKSELKFETSIHLVDVTIEDDVRKVIDKIELKYSNIGILINSAGITGKTNLRSHETDTGNVRKVFDVNFMGAYFTSKYVLPLMVKNNYGRILHIASIAGKEGNAGMLAYSASKAAVIAMTKVQGKEYAENGITVNSIAPAVIHTALVEMMPEVQVKYMTDKIPMKRCGTLQEITDMVAFIVSEKNSFSTGFTFDLSGGRAVY